MRIAEQVFVLPDLCQKIIERRLNRRVRRNRCLLRRHLPGRQAKVQRYSRVATRGFLLDQTL